MGEKSGLWRSVRGEVSVMMLRTGWGKGRNCPGKMENHFTAVYHLFSEPAKADDLLRYFYNSSESGYDFLKIAFLPVSPWGK